MPSQPFLPRPIDYRRAILAVFLRRRAPLAVRDVVKLVRDEEGLEVTASKVSDVLRYQVSRRRALTVGRGVHVVLPEGFSSSTRWRCLNWRDMAAHAADHYGRYKEPPDGDDEP